MPPLLVYTSTGRILGDFIHIFHGDLGREIGLIWRRNRWDVCGRGAQYLLVVVKMILLLEHEKGHSNYSIGSIMT